MHAGCRALGSSTPSSSQGLPASRPRASQPRPQQQQAPAARGSSGRGRVAAAAAAHKDPYHEPAAGPSRRGLLFAATAAALLQVAAAPSPALAASGLGRYIRKKKLDPLETYVPQVLQAQEQLAGLKGTLAADVAGARESLRSGAFFSLRDSVRALGEYAAESGAAADASSLVNGFFRKIEGLDLLLYRAVKDGSALDGPEAEARLDESIEALAALVATVPVDVLERSKRVLEKAAEGKGAAAPVEQTPEDVELLKELLTVWE